MKKETLYSRNDIWDFGTKVRAKKGSPIAGWEKYIGSVVSFRWRDDGGIDYRVRAWRTNQHWWAAEHLDKVADAQFCSSCMRRMECHNNYCKCCHG